MSDKNRRYPTDLITARNTRDPILSRGTLAFEEYNEGDVPQSSGVTVGQSMGSALICFFACECRASGRFSPADMRRREFDPEASLWSLAAKMRCRKCNRLGNIVRITRVRVSTASPFDL